EGKQNRVGGPRQSGGRWKQDGPALFKMGGPDLKENGASLYGRDPTKGSPKQLRGRSLGTKLSERSMRNVRSRRPGADSSQLLCSCFSEEQKRRLIRTEIAGKRYSSPILRHPRE